MRRRPRPRPCADRSVRRAPTGIRGAIRRRPVRRGRPRPRARAQKGFRWTIQSCDALPRGAEPSRPGPRTSGRGAHRPPFTRRSDERSALARRGLTSCRLLRERPACGRPSSCARPACEPRSSCEPPACEPRSSCEPPACELRSSCGPPACERRSSCERPASGELRSSCEPQACVRRSSCARPACVRPSSSEPRACVRPSSCEPPASSEPRACERPSSCEPPACVRRSSSGRGLPGCCHAALPSRFPWI